MTRKKPVQVETCPPIDHTESTLTDAADLEVSAEECGADKSALESVDPNVGLGVSGYTAHERLQLVFNWLPQDSSVQASSPEASPSKTKNRPDPQDAGHKSHNRVCSGLADLSISFSWLRTLSGRDSETHNFDKGVGHHVVIGQAAVERDEGR